MYAYINIFNLKLLLHNGISAPVRLNANESQHFNSKKTFLV